MQASTPFKVHNVLLSEYASQDSDGKPILVGIHVGSVQFRDPMPILPPWFITAVLQPMQTEFSLDMEFNAPSGKNVLAIHVDHKADIVGDPWYRLVLNVQLPAIPYPGDGRYEVVVKDHLGTILFRQAFMYRTGPLQRPQPEVTVEAKLNADFVRKRPAPPQNETPS
jgi:hypothetical protein